MDRLSGMMEFYRRHVQMSMYGFRCQLWEHFKLRPDDEVAEKDKELINELRKIDQLVEDCIIELEDVALPTEPHNIQNIDTIRNFFEDLTKKYKNDIDKVMTGDVIRQKLFAIAAEQMRQAEIEKTKRAVAPQTFVGSPAEMGGATTAKINKNGEIKPATEEIKEEVPQNDKAVPLVENNNTTENNPAPESK